MNSLGILLAILYSVQPLRVVYQNKAYYPIRSHPTDHSLLIRVADFASVLDFTAEYDPSLYKLVLHNSSHTVSLCGDNPFVRVDERMVNLPEVIRVYQGELFASTEQLQYIFGPTLGIDFVLENGNLLRLYDTDVRIRTIRLEERNDTTKLLVYTSAPLQFRSEGTTRGEVALTLFRSALADDLSSPPPTGLVEEMRITPEGDRVRIDVRARTVATAFLVRELTSPPGLSLDFVGPRPAPLRGDHEYGKIQRIVIDPGHGGKDPGAVGASGVFEKDINLQISKRLRTLLENELGVEVVMTREDDSFVPLTERARIANVSSADLFVSIHCNAAPRWKKTLGGVETYFLSVAQTDEARAVEARENASIRFELDQRSEYDFDDVSLILWDLAQNEFLEESQRLAEGVQKGLAECVPVEDRGIKQAGFYVLNGAYMPSVLIECAFISNKKEETLLKSKSFQENLARGIFKGIVAFKKEHEARSST